MGESDKPKKKAETRSFKPKRAARKEPVRESKAPAKVEKAPKPVVVAKKAAPAERPVGQRTKPIVALTDAQCRYGALRITLNKGKVYKHFSVEVAEWLVKTNRALPAA